MSEIVKRRGLAICLSAGISIVGLITGAQADTSNPYAGIIERNPFGLRPPPPPETNAPPAAPQTSAKVILTGIMDLFGKKALLEIEETEAGKGKVTKKPVLREGESEGAIEVISIDVEHNLVKIKNAGVESDLTFEKPKASGPGAAAPAPAPGTPQPMPILPTMSSLPPASAPGSGGPIVISRDGVTPNNGVSVMGGAQPMATPTSSGSGYPANYSAAQTGLSALGASSGNLAYNRPIRTDNVNTAMNPAAPNRPPISKEEAFLHMEVMRETLNETGINVGNRKVPAPPLPPTPLSGMIQAEKQLDANGQGNPFPVPMPQFQGR